MIKLIVFIIISAAIVLRSWSSLRRPQSHGFPRFFAFEFILILILLNAEQWFHEPFSVLQIVSWLLLLASLILAVHGFHLLRVVGKGTGGIETTSVLVRQGAYKYIRHPLYGSLLLLGWGVFLKDPSLAPAVLAIAASVSLVVTARAEEKENLEKFGDDYAAYIKTTRMFIPFLL